MGTDWKEILENANIPILTGEVITWLYILIKTNGMIHLISVHFAILFNFFK